MMSRVSLALLPSPYMVILSTFVSGSAAFFTTSGRALKYISSTAALPIFVMASAFFSMPSASATALARMASASASPLARMPSASWARANFSASACTFIASACCSCSYFFASASRWRSYSSASAFCWRAKRSASAFFRTWASRDCSMTSASFCLSRISFSCLAMLASAVVISMDLRCCSSWMRYAASASAFLVSVAFCSSACRMASSVFFSAISCAAATSASLASFWAMARALAISFSLTAREMAAFFWILTILSTPRFSMTALSSTKFCTLKLTMSRPMAARSGSAFSFTRLANFWRSETISCSSILPTISRMLPSRTSRATLAM